MTRPAASAFPAVRRADERRLASILLNWTDIA
jgi:hypothetical protein